MKRLKELENLIFGLVITSFLGLIAFIGERQVSAMDQLNSTQQENVRKVDLVTSEVTHIKEKINDIKNDVNVVKKQSEERSAKVDKFIQRSYYYWPPREHDELEQ